MTARTLARLEARFGRGRARAVGIVGSFLVLLAVTCAVGIVLVANIPGDGTALDEAVLDVFHRGRTPARTSVWTVITDAGDSLFLVPAAVGIGLAWRSRRGGWSALQLLGGAYLGGAMLHWIAKPVVGRRRPGADVAFTIESGLSFPSGHASQASAFWTALALLALSVVARHAWRAVIAATGAAVVVLVATSRLYLGAHWITDVAAGTVLGAVWAGVLWASLTTRAGPDGAVRGDRS